jgi:lipoprotein-releasing system permease protein
MFGPFERAIAGRYLRARRGERFVSIIACFSLIGISLGVATLIIVTSVMSGFKADLLNRILGFNGDIAIYGNGSSITQYEDISAKLKTLPGVVSVIPVVDGQVLATPERMEDGTAIQVRGITGEGLHSVPMVAGNIRSGSLDKFGTENTIAVGTGLAQRFGLHIGDNITLLAPQGAATAFGTIPRVRAYSISAVFQTGLNEYDSRFVFMPLQEAQVYFQKPNQVTQIEVGIKDSDQVGGITQEIQQAFANYPHPMRISGWQQNNDSFFAAIQVEENVMFIILTLIILVAAFNVVSSMIMLVKDKTGDIAVLRTIGASRSAIMRIFFMCGASVGVLGTILGTLIGVVFCLNIERIRGVVETATGTKVFNPEIYYLTHLPSRLDWHEVLYIVMMSLALSFLATLYPSWRAACTDPVEALRHE